MSPQPVSLAAGAGEVTNLYSVTYNTNNTTGGTTPPTQSATSDSITYTFRVPTADEYGLARTGYTFMGWAESPTASVEQYQGGATIPLDSSNPNKTLYAIWGLPYTLNYSTGNGSGTVPEAEIITIANLPYEYVPTGSQDNIYRKGYVANGWNKVTFTKDSPNPTTTPTWTTATTKNFNTMQDITTSGFCDALNEIGRQLFDIRDGKKYWVAKLADGKCWMTQNLDYDDPNSNRVTSTSGENGGPGVYSTSKPNGWNDNNANATRQYWDPGKKIINGSTLAEAPNNSDEHLLVGNYYSWLSATDGSGKDINTDGANADSSICPEGWKLPLSGSSNGLSVNAALGSFGKLFNLYGITNNATGSTVLRTKPLYYIYSGYVSSGKLNNAGNGGYYWSSTVLSTDNAYVLYFDSTSVSPLKNFNRSYGRSVRCVAR